jgi:hypothetical protein
MSEARVVQRTFTITEAARRDAWVGARVEESCIGCYETWHAGDPPIWHPVEDCPVHGAAADDFFCILNAELDGRWPGTWIGER